MLDRQLAQARSLERYGALTEIQFSGFDDKSTLLSELRRIHSLGWIHGKRLNKHGDQVPCDSRNCGGYTLETELGITPNGLAEPDYLGWEIKTYTVAAFSRLQSSVITLMTPEPDGGMYKELGPEAFIRQFGYPDVAGRLGRLNFGGVHIHDRPHPRTGLRMVLTDFDFKDNKILNAEGGLALVSEDKCAASWSFRKLIEHWKKKHDKTAFLPNKVKKGPPRQYLYANLVQLGQGSKFEMFLNAFISGSLYYDPGIKLEDAPERPSKIKRRNQFRMRSRNLGSLYQRFEQVTL